MTQGTFEAGEVVLAKLFSDDYLFRMPFYQRPYSWTKEEVGELLNDLLGAMDGESDPEPYFLGSIVLISHSGSSEHEVIDGQQRLTTLTMLFCVLRELTEDPDDYGSLDQRVRERPDKYAGSKNRFRLQLRDKDEEFFRANVQESGGIARFLSIETKYPSDPQELILENTRLLWNELSKLSQAERDNLASFVIGNCYLVSVKAYDPDSAHRIFSVLNARGLDLTPTDVLKAEVIGDIPANEGERYTQAWEDIEDELGRDRFRELFGHIFVIETGDRFHRELAKAFSEEVLTQYNGSQSIDKTLGRYAEAFQIVTSASYESARLAEDINRHLVYLQRLGDHPDWVPVAMVMYDRFGLEPEILLELLKGLDRLAYVMFINGIRRDARISRYDPAIKAAKDKNKDAREVLACLQLTEDEQAEVVRSLNGPIYGTRTVGRFVRPLLLRLDSMLADAGAKYDPKIITVEHVLPQSPEKDSEWTKVFPDEDERRDWTNRLANLVLLSRSKNSRAQNYEFDRKKREYFQKDSSTVFALTTQVIGEEKWTPRVLARRQKGLVDAFLKEWGISNS
ncbi:MAG: DUF262 domain-containing HNH endonuclease family protein [Chloroflexi bacterium]|nr:DUF262 domain-containing HNH endonuclease family protein [Chloroflexota bacterium]